MMLAPAALIAFLCVFLDLGVITESPDGFVMTMFYGEHLF